MHKRIDFIENADMGRYLQSLDSVRFLESDFEACSAQAKIEIFTSLMLGRTIPVGEHQFIDSYGLLQNAHAILESLEKLPRSERIGVEHIFPFQLFFRSEYKSLDGLIATKLGDPHYKLSLWQSLGEPDNPKMAEARIEIKKRIEAGSFKYEDDDFVPSGDREAAAMLHKVRNHFLQGEREQIFTLYGNRTSGYAPYVGLLESGIAKICSWTKKDLDSQIRYQAELKDNGIVATDVLEPELKEPATEIIKTLLRLRKLGLIAGNRSHIRIGSAQIRIRGRETLKNFTEIVGNNLLYEAILEIFDTLYNTSIAKACAAHSESVSPARSIVNNIYVRAASALAAMAKNEITEYSELKGSYFNPSWIQGLAFDVGNGSGVNAMLNSMPWDHVWRAYLDSGWRHTLSELNQALSEWDKLVNEPTTSAQKYMDMTYRLDGAYEAHIQNIGRILRDSGWKFAKDGKTNQTVIRFLPWAAGVSAAAMAKLVIGQVGIDPFWEETIPESIGVGAGLQVSRVIEPAGKWITAGYIRRTFARMVASGG